MMLYFLLGFLTAALLFGALAFWYYRKLTPRPHHAALHEDRRCCHRPRCCQRHLRQETMKTIMIECVANGWIVRPFSPCNSWANTDQPTMFVYKTIEELQEAIPMLVGEWQVDDQDKKP